MAESNATQVILTDDGLKIIKAQSTADNAAGGVTNLNSPNLMSVIEKQTAVSQYAGLTSQYNVILARAKDAKVSTDTLTTAYTNLDTFMTPLLTNTAKASDVNRDTYKGLIYTYNSALSDVQNALKDAYNNDIDNMQTNVSVASQAASSAAIVASQAAITGYNASQAAEQASMAADQAKSAGDNATSVANNASQAASGAVIAGSIATVTANKASTAASQAQIAGDNATSVANNASQAASGAVIAGSTATVKADKASTAASQAQIAGDNATSVANNATSIANSATSTADNALSQAQVVGSQASSEIAVQSQATAKAQSTADSAFSQAVTAIDTGQAVSQAVTSLKDGSTLTIAELGNGLATKVSNSEYASYKVQTASQIAQKVDNGAFSAYQQTTADLIASKVATKDFSAYQATTAKSIESKVESSDFNTYKTQTADMISSKVSTADFNDLTMNNRNLVLGTSSKVVQATDWNLQVADIKYGKSLGKNLCASVMINNANHASDLVKGNAYIILNAYDSSGNKLAGASGNAVSYNANGLSQCSISINDGTADIKAYIMTNNMNQNAFYSCLKIEKGTKASLWTPAPEDQATQSDITQSINNINLGFKNSDGSTFQMNLSADGVALLDFSKIILNGTTNIANGTIGTAQIADAAITNAKIANLAVGTAQIANGAITNAQIGSLAVDTANIKDAAISSAKIASLAVGTAQIGDGAITNAKIANLAVGTAQIANGAITNAQIGNAAVDTANIKDAAISSAKIASLAVGTAQIANAAITDAQVGNVSANKLTAGTIDFNTITGKNINASNITTGTLDTNRLNVGQLSALSADLGNVTAGTLKGVNIIANTFSTPNGSFTTEENGAITAKNMTLNGGTLTSPTINIGTINGSTINGTTFNAGDIVNNANNTSHFYPTTISSDGHIYTTQFNPVDAMQTDLSTGALTTKYRAINTTSSNNQYEAYDTTLQAGQIALFAGHTNGKDMSFTQSVTGGNQDGYVLISPLNGMTLHGDNQQITFNGTSADATPKGIIITPYGNINPNGTQNIWYVGNGPTMKTASFGMDADQNVPISLSRQTLVDEIGALGNRLDMGRLFLHAVDNDAQMYLLNDSKPAFVSPTIYNRTYSNGANMFVTSAGRVGRSTSASKYKLAIARSDDTIQADRLMTLKPASWNDKVATEKMAESLSNGEIPVEAEINLKRHYGLIAEDLRDAGLDEFLITGDNGQIEGIEYDRLWTVLIPKIKQLNNRINELERKTL